MTDISSLTEKTSSNSLMLSSSLPKSKFSYVNMYWNELGVCGWLFLQGFVYPLERIKVLQQVDLLQTITNKAGKITLLGNVSEYLQTSSDNKAMEQIYRGLGAKLTKFISREFLTFAISDRVAKYIQRFSASEDPLKYTVSRVFGGATAGALLETLLYPLEMAKTRILCDRHDFQNRLYPNLNQALFGEAAIGSPYTIFHGLGLSLVGAAIYRGIQIGSYETLLAFGLKDLSWDITIPTAIGITMAAQRISYPIDTMRRHLMLRGTLLEPESADFRNMYKQVFARPQNSDLMKGWNIQCYKSISTGIFLALYKATLDTKNERPDFISKFG